MQIGIPLSFPVMLYVALLGISAQAEDTSFAHAKCIQKGFQEHTKDHAECIRQFLKSIGSSPLPPPPPIAIAPSEKSIAQKGKPRKELDTGKAEQDMPLPKPTDDKARKELEASKAAQDKLRKELEAAKATDDKSRKELEAAKSAEEKLRKELEAAKSAEEKLRKESEAAMAELEQRLKAKAEQAQSEKLRKDQLERTMKQVPGTGTGAQTGPPGAEYGAKVRDAIRPNLLLIKEVSPNLKAEYLVKTVANGKIVDAKLTKSSGDTYFDDVALKAILKTERLPPDKDGKVPSPMVIVVSP